MLFPTFSFLLFFLAVFIGFWYVFRAPATRRAFLVFANFAFYAFSSIPFCALLLASALANYAFALLIGKNREYLQRKTFLIISIVFNLLILGFFKYYGFFAEQVNALILGLSRGSATRLLPIIAVGMPLGLSYYTFKAMSYVFDVYLCKINATSNFADVLIYISFFPQIASGPIVHAEDFFPSLPQALSAGAGAAEKPIRFDKASALIVSGLAKKLVFSNFLSTLVVSPVFEDLTAVHSLDALFAAFAYTIVIYCDFSGYSDIAIGVALLLGFETPLNFRRPYASFSVTEFWKRWHITFSAWLRDYLYFSLGGSRFGLARTLFALLFTMVLGGLWHGASWTFLLWGAMQGAALVLERALGYGERPAKNIALRVLQTAGTFLFATLSWVVFRASSIAEIGEWLRALANFDSSISFVAPLPLILAGAGLLMHFVPQRINAALFRAWTLSPFYVKGALLAAFFAGLSAVGMSAVAPFIYFSF